MFQKESKFNLMVARNQHFVPVTWGSSIKFSIVQFFVALLFVVFFIGAIFMAGEYVTFNMVQVSLDDAFSGDSKSECNLFSGKWVFDNTSYPLYKEKDCKFMSDQLACNKFGRENLSYQYWRWQPHHCDLPRSLSFSSRMCQNRIFDISLNKLT